MPGEPPGRFQQLRARVAGVLMRIAASGIVPARMFLPSLPGELAPKTGRLRLEIVSHCWNYDQLLAYQLSSLVNHPPSDVTVTASVFYSPEDEGTAATLAFFEQMNVPGVTWNWRPLDKYSLFRRAIGRNIAAKTTGADWIWFTDCDVIFHDGCLDALGAQLQGRRDRLVFPRIEHCTPLLTADDPLLSAAADGPRLVEIDTSLFHPRTLEVAKGPMQITHGDLARAVGYCEALDVYQRPEPRWSKAWEDRAYRWLLRTDGAPIDVPAVYRIRHSSKGRYRKTGFLRKLRGMSRRLQSVWRDRRLGK